MTVSWLESFCASKSVARRTIMDELAELETRTALTSPRLPHLAKCALRVAFELPAATPQSALSMLAELNTMIRVGLAKAGDRQSSIMAASLNMSAASLQRLHSGSSADPNLCANKIVMMRPNDSWKTERRRAVVGLALESPTPTPGTCQLNSVMAATKWAWVTFQNSSTGEHARNRTRKCLQRVLWYT
jgi:hypothetical protein